MSNIITEQEFKDLKDISGKAPSKKMEQVIKKAHIDLRERLGDAFYYDVVQNQAEANYTDLLDGAEYTRGDFTVYQEGLKQLVAEYAYARYLYEVNINVSPFGGAVTKNSQDSEPVDRGVIKDMVKQTQQDADSIWQLIEDYLNENAETFTVWAKQQESSGIEGSSNTSGFNQTRFTILSGNKDKF